MDCVFKLPSHFGFQGVPHHQLPPQYQKIVERLKVVEQEISGGAMAIVAVVLNNKLYIANVGELVSVNGSVSGFLRMAGVLGSKRHLNVGNSFFGLWPSSGMLATYTST